MKSLVFPLALLVATGLPACGKDAPKKPVDEPKATTPVPSDMVFNDFVPSNGSGSGMLGVKTDGGGIPEGGMGDTPAETAGAAPDSPEGDPATKLKVTEPGAEPRAARKYTFAVGKVDKRVMVVRQEVSREGQPPQGQSFAVTGDFIAKATKPTATRFEMKVVKVDLPDAPPAQKAQAQAQLAVFNGLVGVFDVTPHGNVGELDFKADERMQGGGAEVIVQSLQQALEVAVAPLPDEPIGIGAKWEGKAERKDRGQESTVKKTFTLTDVSADGGTITAEVELTVPKHPFQQRGVPPGATEEVKGKGLYTYVFKFDHIATKVSGEMIVNHRIELSDGKGPKQAVVETIKLKNSLEQVGGAAPAGTAAPKP